MRVFVTGVDSGVYILKINTIYIAQTGVERRKISVCLIYGSLYILYKGDRWWKGLYNL